MDKITLAPRDYCYRRVFFSTAIIAIASLISSLSAQGLDSTANVPESGLFSLGVECNGSSRYVWRGMACSDDAVVQASGWITAGGFTFSVWANYDVTRSIGENRLNEIDYTLEYERNLDRLALTAGTSVYSYHGQIDVPATTELYCEVSWEAAVFRPFSRHSVDIGEYLGAYFGEAGIRVFLLSRERFSAELETGVGWASAKFNETYFGDKAAAIDVAIVNFNCSYLITETIYLTPRIEVSELLNKTIRGLVDNPRLVNASLTVGVGF